MSTISDLITAAIAGAETNTEISYSEESVEAVSSFDGGDSDAEKIASALEYIAERGVESFIVNIRISSIRYNRNYTCVSRRSAYT